MYKFCKTEQSFQRQRELEKGLLSMMEHHRFEEISVSDLCDRMRIPRKSFYRYFTSKEGALYALLDHTIMEFYDSGSIEGLRGGTPIGDLERFFQFWKSHRKLIDAALRSNLGGMLVERAVNLAKYTVFLTRLVTLVFLKLILKPIRKRRLCLNITMNLTLISWFVMTF